MGWNQVIFVGALLALGGCAAVEDRPAQLTPKQAAEIDKALDGKVAGKPVTCVSRVIGQDGLRAASDDVLLYKVNRNLTYRNDLMGACNGISRGDTLVLQPTNDQYCRGDIAFVVDLNSGMRGPSCVLGDFVPYRTVK
ncbi:MAG: hypothetical protein ABW184_07950 [Sphingobium sp.]